MGLMDKLKNPTPEQLVREKAAAEAAGTYSESAQKKAMATAIMNPQLPVAAKPQAATSDPVYSLVTNGDLSRLNESQRLSYYHQVCKDLGLNPLTKPFDFIKLNGKLLLYPNKDCTAQLSRLHTVSCRIIDKMQDKQSGTLLVFVRASTPDGRETDQVGGVALFEKMRGEDVANAWMKCITKANRRAVLTHCGLGMTDESELDTIPPGKIQRIEDSATAKPVDLAPVPLPPVSPVTAQLEEAKVEEAGIVDGEAENPPSQDAGAGNFKYEEKADRQWLIKEIQNRFPGISKENLKQIAETYQNEHSKEVIGIALNEVHRKMKGVSSAL